jgi:hypothetical protein
MRFARALWLLLWASFFYSISAGCNSVLGNEEGHLAPPPLVTDAADEPVGVDQGAPPVDATSESSVEDGGENCAFGKKPCFGACVDRTDPHYGCGSAACDECGSAHAQSVACGPVNNEVACILTCQPGWADCDGDNKNGCETDLSKPESCGACKTVCDSNAPLCAVQGATYGCVNQCPVDTTKCGSQCVHTDSDPANCGGCGTICPGTNNGAAKCVNKVCTFACNPLYHKCGNACASDTDKTKCGAACRDCTTSAPFQASATACTNNTCVFACNPGTFGSQWLDCNGDVNSAQSNGCETNTWNNNASCGACFAACSSGGSIDGGGIDSGGGTIDASKTDALSPPDSSLPDPSDTYCCHTSCVPTSQTCF